MITFDCSCAAVAAEMMSVKSFVLAGLVGAMMPSLAAAGGIYGEYDDIEMTDKEKQGVVGALTILIFILMATEITGPEVLFLIALMIVTLLQIITLQDALSGKPIPLCWSPIAHLNAQDSRTSR